ncbi:DNA polymerase III, delta subunit [Thermanaeromonas toyohensis ToBE]|uniref:DNA polymerase III subunit delta n=1 Tax=Thermanaeromonas toyohensis ToBE TaxID=698762 RepID=A0A1W1VHZ2_9FIRM|nr:DNA polymerase III subunit delta [Thermanaeromonas toyohensis]SMB92893.1 DNA polymerase III, delta subunit [Thermanaeromonas toyohensis ToBE]
MTWQEFQKELATGFVAPVYLFYGQEKYLIARAVEALKNKLLGPGAELFDYQEFEGEEVTHESLLSATRTPPVLSIRRLIVVKDAPLNEEALLAALSPYCPTTCLVLIAGEEIDKRKKLVKAVQQAGRIVELKGLPPTDLAQWFKEEARKQGRAMEEEAAQALAETVIGLEQGLKELAKLDLYLPPGTPITLRDVEALIPTSLNSKAIFQLLDALTEGDRSTAIDLCRRLLASGEAPLAILGMIARQFRLILLAHIHGLHSPLTEVLGLHPWAAKKIARLAQKYSLASAASALEKILKADVALKTGATEPRLILEQLIWTLTRPRPG